MLCSPLTEKLQFWVAYRKAGDEVRIDQAGEGTRTAIVLLTLNTAAGCGRLPFNTGHRYRHPRASASARGENGKI